MKTIYQVYTNGTPTKSVFNTEVEALECAAKLKSMYKKVSIEIFDIPTKY